MIEFKPRDVRLTPFKEAEFAYRGISRQQRHNLGHNNDRLQPEEQLQETAEMIALFYRNLPLEHVLALKKRHFCSFSLWYDVAVYYATYEEPKGFVVKVRLPEVLSGIEIGDEVPVVWEGKDGTEWIDPRYLLPPGSPLFNLLAMPNDSITAGDASTETQDLQEWLTMKNRAQVDDEILLARDAISPVEIIPVSRKDRNPSFKPWVETVEKLQSELNLTHISRK